MSLGTCIWVNCCSFLIDAIYCESLNLLALSLIRNLSPLSPSPPSIPPSLSLIPTFPPIISPCSFFPHHLFFPLFLPSLSLTLSRPPQTSIWRKRDKKQYFPKSAQHVPLLQSVRYLFYYCCFRHQSPTRTSLVACGLIGHPVRVIGGGEMCWHACMKK